MQTKSIESLKTFQNFDIPILLGSDVAYICNGCQDHDDNNGSTLQKQKIKKCQYSENLYLNKGLNHLHNQISQFT